MNNKFNRVKKVKVVSTLPVGGVLQRFGSLADHVDRFSYDDRESLNEDGKNLIKFFRKNSSNFVLAFDKDMDYRATMFGCENSAGLLMSLGFLLETVKKYILFVKKYNEPRLGRILECPIFTLAILDFIEFVRECESDIVEISFTRFQLDNCISTNINYYGSQVSGKRDVHFAALSRPYERNSFINRAINSYSSYLSVETLSRLKNEPSFYKRELSVPVTVALSEYMMVRNNCL